MSADLCLHCGAPPEADGDHTCPCPLTDAECLEREGHGGTSISLTTPRQYTARGGWSIACECGAPLGDTGYSQEEQDAMWREHQAEVRGAGPSSSGAVGRS